MASVVTHTRNMIEVQMSPQSPTRERLVETARLLFWERGYEATSLADVVEKAGARSGSLYYFFRTKEELLLAVLDRYVDLLWPIVIEPVFSRVTDPIGRIFGILDGYRQGLVYTGCTQGCPIGNLALEVCDDLPRAREKIARNFEGWRGWIRKCLDEARDRFPIQSQSRATGGIRFDGHGRRRDASACPSEPGAVRRVGGATSRLL